MSVVIECEFFGCGVKKEAESGAVALGLMQLHQAIVHPVTQKQKLPPKWTGLELPEGQLVKSGQHS